MISVEHLTKCYGGFKAVDDLSFEIDEGHVYGFLGPNGAGKSTTMNIMTGCLSATEGSVKIDGYDIFEDAGKAKKLIGYLPEQPPLYPEMTVQEYLDFVAELKGVKRAQRKQQMLAAAHRTGLEEVLPRVIRSLSKGYKQRVGIAQAVITTALVDIALVALHFARPDIISLASAITLGSIAAATAPAATLMVVKQYKADGPLTKLLLMVVAIDDAVGLVLFSASYGVANALEQGRIDPMSVVLEPLLEIALSLALGAAAGYLLNLLEVYFHSRSKRMSLSVAFVLLTVGLSMTEFEINGTRCGFSLLLVCMMTGTVFCNVCPTSEELMERVDGWTMPLNILFFVISGAELDLNVLSQPVTLIVGIIYIIARSAGKYCGANLSCRITKEPKSIVDHLGITLLPQAGVALGMAITAASLSDGALARNVVLFAVLVYELVGPTLTKRSLLAVGEIRPEGRTNARKQNDPKEAK